jgi:hypothetical protein
LGQNIAGQPLAETYAAEASSDIQNEEMSHSMLYRLFDTVIL